MRLYLYTDKVTLWIRNLGCSRREFIEKCTFPKSARFSRDTQKKINRIIRGRNYNNRIPWEKQLWKALVNINRNTQLVDILQEAYNKVSFGIPTKYYLVY